MPTIRAVIPVTLQFDVEVTRDFNLNAHFQIAEALYQRILALDESGAIDFFIEAISEIGEGKPIMPEINGGH